MIRHGCWLFGLLLLAPLVHLPGFGFDGARLPVTLALAAALLALLAAGAVRGFPVASSSPWTFAAAIAFLAVHLAALRGAVAPGEGAEAVLVLAAGVAALAFTRAGGLPAPFLYETVPWILVGLSAVVSLICIGQAMAGIEPAGLEGNTNYSGTLAGMLLPLTAAFAAAGTTRRRLLAGAASALLFVALLLTESRGGLVAALVGLLIAGGTLVIRRSARTAAVPLVFLGLLVLVPLVFQARAHLSAGRAETSRIRFGVWEGAGKLWSEAPVLGVGPGNFAVLYPTVRSREEARLSHRHVDQGFKEVEDAHSSWVQIAAETGTLGLLAFLALGGLAAWRWGSAVRRGADPEDLVVVVGAGGAVAAYLVAGLFNSLTLHVSHTVLFFAIIGLVERFAASERPSAGWERGVTAGVAGLGAFVFLVGAWEAGVRGLAEGAYYAAIRVEPAKRPAILERWADKSPHAWRVHYALGGAYRRLGYPGEAMGEYRKALAVRPYQAAVLNDMVVALLQSGAREEAVAWLARTERVAPHCYLTPLNRGTLAANERRFEDALAEFRKAVSLKENHASVHYRIGRIHLLLGRVDEAVDPLFQARRLGFDVGSALRVDVPSVVGDERLATFFGQGTSR